MRESALSKQAPAHFPSSGTSRKTGIRQTRRIAFEKIIQAKIFRALSQQTLLGQLHQVLTGSINESKLVITVKREDCDVDFFHYLAQKRGCFQRIETLGVQRLRQCIHFASDLGERIP